MFLHAREKNMVRSLAALFAVVTTVAVVVIFLLCVEKNPQHVYPESIDLLADDISNVEKIKSTGLLNPLSFIMVTAIVIMATLFVMWGTWIIARQYYQLPLTSLKHYIHDLVNK